MTFKEDFEKRFSQDREKSKVGTKKGIRRVVMKFSLVWSSVRSYEKSG